MADNVRLVDLVQSRLDGFLDDRSSIVTSVGDDVTALLDDSRRFLSGGKRFRAQFCHWGWRAVAGARETPVTQRELDAVIGAASALELFHAAALVHDDVIDSSDTRRGEPSAHRRFAERHGARRWAGDAGAFGTSSAILLGDLLLGWSDELLDDALFGLGDADRARAARHLFNTMRTDVTAGQYLDVLEENAWVERDEQQLLEAARRVVVFKSAKYSIEAPLQIGAAIAGASEAQLATLSEFGLPLGIAFQLRDDLLGVFGDAAVTGKPSGDDLREGKRTVLVALTRSRVSPSVRRVFDDLLGDPQLTTEQVLMLQGAMRDSGAVDEIEAIIEREVRSANAALDEASLAPEAIAALRRLTARVTDREA
ncbi:polyprenyl synthetase family protein [Gryllotalpicola protaetiae]|uniref:Polyprenyl synthetase family protein n=1 Tax=Gryllotalpicola protaetiae TaxID=2419771 RepID=A0A387BV50_9MICO|nr:polyprenyl synthetase family protein [Gryllotalpicola protaetiae]AYG04747.1 polyprenyl synthetase family protein [Gryllotalpicola protaetiae]